MEFYHEYFAELSPYLLVAAGGGPVTNAQLTQALAEQTRIMHAMLKADKAKQANDTARGALREPYNYPNVPIPKSCPGLPAHAPVPMVANRPPAVIGATLPISHANPVQDWCLPALPGSNLSVHRVRLIEYWYNEDFQLPADATQKQAVAQLDSWIRGAI